jgi:hypothetical protein
MVLESRPVRLIQYVATQGAFQETEAEASG